MCDIQPTTTSINSVVSMKSETMRYMTALNFDAIQIFICDFCKGAKMHGSTCYTV